MKKKRGTITLLPLFTLSIDLVGCVSEEPKETGTRISERAKTSSEVKEWEWYESKEGGFRIKYPAGWRKIEHDLTERDIGADVPKLYSPGLEEGKGKNFVEFGVRIVNFIWAKNYNLKHERKLYEGIDLDNITLEEGVGVKFNDLQKMSRLTERVNNTSLDSLPAKEIEYISKEKCTFYSVIVIENKKAQEAYKIDPSGEKIKGTIVCAISGNRGYTLSLEGLVSGHDKYSDLASQMVDSFEFV